MCCDTKLDATSCCGANGEKMGFHKHGRRFITKTEQLEKLEKYKEMLQKEIQGVDEHISELNN